jgi:hypothetical protein
MSCKIVGPLQYIQQHQIQLQQPQLKQVPVPPPDWQLQQTPHLQGIPQKVQPASSESGPTAIALKNARSLLTGGARRDLITPGEEIA